MSERAVDDVLQQGPAAEAAEESGETMQEHHRSLAHSAAGVTDPIDAADAHAERESFAGAAEVQVAELADRRRDVRRAPVVELTAHGDAGNRLILAGRAATYARDTCAASTHARETRLPGRLEVDAGRAAAGDETTRGRAERATRAAIRLPVALLAGIDDAVAAQARHGGRGRARRGGRRSRDRGADGARERVGPGFDRAGVAAARPLCVGPSEAVDESRVAPGE